MTKRTLICWIGGKDLSAADSAQDGPILSTLKAVPFDRAVFLYNYPETQVNNYLAWLGKHSPVRVQAIKAELTSPIHFADIYEAADQQLAMQKSAQADVSILLSPGTPAMQAVWILLGKTRYPCQFYQSSLEQGVQRVDIPFELSMEYLPAAKSIGSDRINQLANASAPVNAAFDNIITRNNRMQTLKAQAQVLAEREVPVLIYGETGTGKELFARAIHNASQRADKPFVPVNCGAIPPDLVDSMLFGHKKGAFTGAASDKPGVFAQADGGTLFLDEFGELDPSVQVRLLRVLQEGAFTPLGASKELCVNVRLITATHRNLMEKVSDGTFREDLFYRIAVGVLHLPPLREREGDLTLLAKRVLKAIGEKDSGLKDKKISPEAMNIILRHPWRGNVRELQSSLLRAALWCHTDMIQAEDMRQSLFLMPERSSGIMTQDISQGIDLKEIVDNVARHYIPLALDAAQGKKTRAAQLLGLNNYQTLSNWMEKLDIS